jgi:hypothetical protein
LKGLQYLILISVFACCVQTSGNGQIQRLVNQTPESGNAAEGSKGVSWTGMINSRIPVFISYSIQDSLVMGEIRYLNTKEKKPIRLLGTIEEGGTYRLLEFSPTGTITGLITGTPAGESFAGSWASPETGKELSLSLTRRDTLIRRELSKPVREEISGHYHYQYGQKGFMGDFEVERVDKQRIAFSVLSLTNVERGPNIAEVEKDTVALTGNSFIYMIPDSDNCEFKVSFYKDFVYITYTRGYCAGQFGLNATIDGIFVKTK